MSAGEKRSDQVSGAYREALHEENYRLFMSWTNAQATSKNQAIGFAKVW